MTTCNSHHAPCSLELCSWPHPSMSSMCELPAWLTACLQLLEDRAVHMVRELYLSSLGDHHQLSPWSPSGQRSLHQPLQVADSPFHYDCSSLMRGQQGRPRRLARSYSTHVSIRPCPPLNPRHYYLSSPPGASTLHSTNLIVVHSISSLT